MQTSDKPVAEIAEFVEGFYNHRLHLILGYAIPAEYEIHPQAAVRAA